ncbi:MAG: hypothetical protein Q8P18_12680 [Pseudomonadota bacterium]|nr:hypothetical protein [Pseudomonadota bacterium]
MFTPGGAARAPERPQPLGRDAGPAVRAAFDALVRASRNVLLAPGALSPIRLPPAGREAWIGGLLEALAKVPALTIEVSPSGLTLGDTALLDPADRALAERLYGAGARAITLFAGASDADLVALAALLLTEWGAEGGAIAFAGAAWGAELTHIHLDLASIGALVAATPGKLPAIDLLERPPEEPTRLGALGPDGLQALRMLRDTLPPEPASFVDVFPTAGTLPLELMADAARVRAGLDIDPAELGRALLAAMLATPTTAGGVARALLGAAIDLIGGPIDASPLLHLALEATDPELTPEDATRTAACAAFAELTRDPLRGALVAALPAAETPELRAQLFSLLSLPLPEEGVLCLPALLPQWAIQVVADTELLRETENGRSRDERVRARLSAQQPGVISLGLAMAARLDDPRMVDAILPLASHVSGEVRLGALMALRKQMGARVCSLVFQRLADPVAAVRVEALRYGVAHRVPDMLPWIEARLHEPDLSAAQEPELRALCVAFGRLGRERAESALTELAMGRRRLGHPALGRLALHGLRAINSSTARAALQHVAAEVPRLRQEAEALLSAAPAGGDPR